MTRRMLWAALAAAVTIGGVQAQSGDYNLYVGTYTRRMSKGIYAWRFHSADGSLTPLGLVAESSNPSFLAVSPNGKFLYAANEDASGMVSAFAIDAASGKLTPLNKVSSKGNAPCHLSLDKSGKWLFVANYESGNLASFPVHPDGSLGEAKAVIQHSGSSVNPQRQSGPHAHSVVVSPDGRFLLSADLGLDEVTVYKIGADGSLTPADPPFVKLAPGSGPRHIAFSPDGHFAYVVSELIPGVNVFRYNAQRGSLTWLQQISALPEDWKGAKSGAEIVAHGKFVYTSNRGADNIAEFQSDGKGKLTAEGRFPTGGRTPRNFAIDPTGKWLFAANQDSNSIGKFSIDPKTGALTATGEKLEVGAPVCIVFVAAHP